MSGVSPSLRSVHPRQSSLVLLLATGNSKSILYLHLYLLEKYNNIVHCAVQRKERKRKNPWRQKRGHKYLRPPFPAAPFRSHVTPRVHPATHTPPNLWPVLRSLPKHPWPQVYFNFLFCFSLLASLSGCLESRLEFRVMCKA